MGKPRFELEYIWRYDQYDYAMMDICTFFQCVSCRKKIPCPGTENCTRINISSRYGRLITILVGNGMGMVLPILPYFPSLKVQLSVAYIVTECLRSKKESYKTVQCQWAETWNRLELVQAIFQAHQTTGEAEFILVDMFTSRVFTSAGLDNCRLESFAPLPLEYVAPSAISIGTWHHCHYIHWRRNKKVPSSRCPTGVPRNAQLSLFPQVSLAFGGQL